jgi:hypothetical protein
LLLLLRGDWGRQQSRRHDNDTNDCGTDHVRPLLDNHQRHPRAQTPHDRPTYRSILILCRLGDTTETR